MFLRKIASVAGLISVSLLAVACNDTTEENPSNNGGTPEGASSDQSEEQASVSNRDETEEEDSLNEDHDEENGDNDYTEERVAGDYLIFAEPHESFGVVFQFTRTADELTREERFQQSLQESDPSQRDLFSATTHYEMDERTANFYYNDEDTLSMAATESNQFWEVLHELSFRFGINEINLFNQDGERDLHFAQMTIEEPIEVDHAPTRGYYVRLPENHDQGESQYVSGNSVGKEMYYDDDELLDFSQTIEAMASVDDDNGDYGSGLYEGLNVQEATIDDNQAIVSYNLHDGSEPSEQERIDFEHVVQLAALDFQVEELRLVNETEKVISIYPLAEPFDFNEDEQHEESNEQEESTAITREDASNLVFDYIRDHGDYDLEEVQIGVEDREDEEDVFVVRVFVFSGEMMNTVGWYQVDKETGEVEERQ